MNHRSKRTATPVRAGSHALACGLLLIPLLVSASGQTNGLPESVLARLPHTTEHFLIRGGDYLRNVEFGQWAEEIVDTLERELARPVPFQRNQPLRIELRDEPAGRPRVFPAQSNEAGDLVQRVVVNRPAEIDHEELLESLVLLLCSRHVMVEARRHRAPDLVPRVPEWFSTGLAQYMVEDLRGRNRRITFEDWRDLQAVTPSELLTRRVFLEGRLKEKATAAMFYGYLKSQPNFLDLIDKFFVNWSLKRPVDLDFLLHHLEGVDTDRDLLQEWDLWMASNEAELREVWDVDLREQIASLKSYMKFRPRQLGLLDHPHADVPITWRELISMPRDEWHAAMVNQLIMRVQFLGLGQPDSFRGLLDEFVGFLRALAPKVADQHNGEVPALEERRTMALFLTSGQRSLVEYEQRMEAARSLIEMVDKEPNAVSPPPPPPRDVPAEEPVLSDDPTPEEFQAWLKWLEAQDAKRPAAPEHRR